MYQNINETIMIYLSEMSFCSTFFITRDMFVLWWTFVITVLLKKFDDSTVQEFWTTHHQSFPNA